MISTEILELIKENNEIKKFLEQSEDFEVLYKKLTQKDLNRLFLEYSGFLDTNIKTLICVTLIRQSPDVKNFIKSKKIKVYIDEVNQKIVRILQT